MKKIGIVTIIDNENIGNRLQNYALQTYLEKEYLVYTLKNDAITNTKNKLFLRKIKCFIEKIISNIKNKRDKRYNNFRSFNKNINYYSHKVYPNSKRFNKVFDYFVVGSDQVWNPKFDRLREVDLLSFADSEKRISYSASFGIDELTKKDIEQSKKYLNNFKALSVREERGRIILESFFGKKDIEVLVDPTMLLDKKEWDLVAKKPNQLKNSTKYVLLYFLGTLSDERYNIISKFANSKNYRIINLLDKNSEFYNCGPSEFVYLEKNAELICTDSFHSCVFAILYNKPFIVYNRVQEGITSMNSRIETLLSKFKLENRVYNEKNITKKNLICDYYYANEILNKERIKAENFIKKHL